MEKDRIYGIHCNVDNCVYNSNNCEYRGKSMVAVPAPILTAVTKQSKISGQEANSSRHGHGHTLC
ncbi:MAG: hypothetical protein ACLTCP_12495 [Ruminococcus bicirculans (ex Wegman et al. 2014)]